MVSRAQYERQRADRELLQRAADTVRGDASRRRAEAVAGCGDAVPASQWPAIAVLESLARAAGRGVLPDDLRHEARDWARRLLVEHPGIE